MLNAKLVFRNYDEIASLHEMVNLFGRKLSHLDRRFQASHTETPAPFEDEAE